MGVPLLLARACKVKHDLDVTTSDDAVDDIVVEPRVSSARPREACNVDNRLANIIVADACLAGRNFFGRVGLRPVFPNT